MQRDDRKKIHPLQDPHDPLAQFLFGNKQKKDIEITEEQVEDRQEFSLNQQENSSLNEWLFGNNAVDEHKMSKKETNATTENPLLNELMHHIDIDKFAETIDTFMSTASQLKPLWKKIHPIINKWIK